MVIKKVQTLKEEKDISKYVEETEELVKMIQKLKGDKTLYFHIYNSLKGFDLVMSVLGKEKILEYFTVYMKDNEKKNKNYSKFIEFIGEKEGQDFFNRLREVYKGIVSNYDSIVFLDNSYHLGSEEIYLRETLEKVKTILESLGELEEKKFIKIKMNFLNLSNSNLDFKFTDADLDKIDFYDRLNELDEETSKENLLPFFYLLNRLMEELKITQERVNEMVKEFEIKINKDIDILYKNHKNIELDFIKKTKIDIKSYISKKELVSLDDIIKEIQNKLEILKRDKELLQSTVNEDIKKLEGCLEKLKKNV